VLGYKKDMNANNYLQSSTIAKQPQNAYLHAHCKEGYVMHTSSTQMKVAVSPRDTQPHHYVPVSTPSH